MKTPQKHAIISGFGRSGTTFLVELCTHLGLDTGFDQEMIDADKDPIGRAGLEIMNVKLGGPYIIKNPLFIDYLHPFMRDSRLEIEYVFVPVRNIRQAAESRRTVTKDGSEKGGLWGTDSTEVGAQERVLQQKLCKLMVGISEYNVPVILINYPKLTEDSTYLYDKLKPILKDITFDHFDSVFNRVVNPDLVHNYKK